LQAEDLKQAATIIAYFIYASAEREDKIPRKEPPAPGATNNR
jgi:carboxypeptidase Q